MKSPHKGNRGGAADAGDAPEQPRTLEVRLRVLSAGGCCRLGSL